jgi:transposase-like protein
MLWLPDEESSNTAKDACFGHRPGAERLHYPIDVMLLCVRWYVAYSLSLCNLEEMMAERGIAVDHSTVHRWVIKRVPQAHGKEVRGELTDRVQAA